MLGRRDLISYAAGAACAAALGRSGPARAQTYPGRPVTWIVPYPPGGPVDVIARRAAELLAPKLGQPVVVENKAGAAGAIGSAEIARSKPDGYTLGLATTDTLVSAMLLQKTPGYDSRRDLTLIGKLCYSQQLLVVPAKSGIHDLRSLVAAAKAKPGGIAFATWGPGSVPHLYMKSLEAAAGIELLDVAYRGLAPAVQDLLGGQIGVALVPPSVAVTYGQKGLINVISVSGGGRLKQLPQVATVQEQGFQAPMFDYTYWAALVGPRALPPEIGLLWRRLVLEVQAMPEFESSLIPLGMLPSGRVGSEFASDVRLEFELIGSLTRRLGIMPE